MKFFTTATIAASVAALLSAQALAATTAPLASGKPAGVHSAQNVESLLIPLAIAGVAAGVLIAATSGGNGNLTNSPPAAQINTSNTTI